MIPSPGYARRPVIVSQLGATVDAKLAAHPSQPIVRALKADEAPWGLAEPADALFVRPFVRPWDAPPKERPVGWPGPLRWVFTVSAGVDFFPGWFLEADRHLRARRDRQPDRRICARRDPAARQAARGDPHAQARGFPHCGARRPRGPDARDRRLRRDRRPTALRARAFGMRVLALKRSAWELAPEGIEPVAEIGELFARSDHVLLALPATPATRHIVNADALARARPGLHLVNVARGALVDQDALIAALDAGRLAGATLDVTDPEPLPAGHPLYTHPAVRLTPHSSWASAANGARLVAKALDNIERYARDEPLTDVVDSVRGY